MEKIFQVSDVFTPTSPAKLTFVERERINTRIVRALQTPGTQIIVYGQSGSGKTTLLENKLFQVYENHIKTSCMKGMSFESVMLDAFDQLSVYYLSNTSIGQESSIESSLKSSYQLINAQIKVSTKKSENSHYSRIMPPQLTAQNLARFMGAVDCCWILDDFHKVQNEDKESLSQLMKVFMDMSIDYKNLKIICVGAENTARQVVEYDNEMKNRVAEIKIPLMSSNEIKEIIEKGFKLLNLKVDNKLLCEDIYYYSNGLAAICHKLCLLMCEACHITETVSGEKIGRPGVNLQQEKVGSDHLSYAINEYLDDASDSIKSSFDLAFRIDGAPILLEALSECGEDGDSIEALQEISESYGGSFGLKESETILKSLQCDLGGAVIKYDEDSRVYCFTNPFFMTFARTLFEHSSYRPKMSPGEMLQLLNSAFSTLRKNYSSSDLDGSRYAGPELD